MHMFNTVLYRTYSPFEGIPIKKFKREAGHSTSTAYDIEGSTCDGATHKNCFSSFKIVFKG